MEIKTIMFKLFKKKKMIGKLTVEQYEQKREEHNRLAQQMVYPQETKDYHLRYLYGAYIAFCSALLNFDSGFETVTKQAETLDTYIANNEDASSLRLASATLLYSLRIAELDRPFLDQQIHVALSHYRFSDVPEERERNDITYLFTAEALKDWDKKQAKTPEGSVFNKFFDPKESGRERSFPLQVCRDFVFSEEMVQLFKGVLDKICEHYYDNVISTLDTGLRHDYTPYFLGGQTYAELLAPFYEKANKYRHVK